MSERYEDNQNDDLEQEDYEQSEREAHEQRRRNARAAGRQFRQRITEADEPEREDKEPLLSPAIKGIIGILVSLVFVAIIIMLFAKVLFLHEPNQDQKTGTITVTSPTGTTITTTTGLNQRQSKETKETIKYNDNHKKTEKGQKQQSQRIKCISAVLVHPEPNSSSANLTTVPAGAEVDFIKNENGWYYITYNGTTGYAWGQFFEAPQTTTMAQF